MNKEDVEKNTFVQIISKAFKKLKEDNDVDEFLFSSGTIEDLEKFLIEEFPSCDIPHDLIFDSLLGRIKNIEEKIKKDIKEKITLNERLVRAEFLLKKAFERLDGVELPNEIGTFLKSDWER